LRWYSGTVLGLYPVLDGREILALARAIANGDLPAEPFYRAPLYPAILAMMLKLGLPDPALVIGARTFNLVCHIVSTASVYLLGKRVWRSRRSAFVAGALWGLNPVALYFAGDPLDITFAITMMLVGTVAVSRLCDRKIKARYGSVIACALFWSLAALARPHFLSLVAICPLIMLVLIPETRHKFGGALLALLVCAMVLAGLGYANYRLSGDFRVTPWQGAYNFWAANRPGAHGRFYEQSMTVRAYDESTNTARVESERLYEDENPDHPTTDYRVLSDYWNARSWKYIREQPGRFINHLSSKFSYLINNFEQYNNKTYDLHKRLSPWLAYNPVCFGLLLALAAAGAFLGWRRPLTRLIVVCIAVYAAGVTLYFVSARFRLPLAPLLAVLSGWVTRPRWSFQHAGPRGRAVAATVAAITVGIASFLPLPEKERTETYVNDYLLMARAASQLQRHDDAVAFAEAAFRQDPAYRATSEMLCVTGFNRLLYRLPEKAPAESLLRDDLEHCQKAARELGSEQSARIAGIYFWRLGERDKAARIWHQLVDSSDEQRTAAVQAMILTATLRDRDVALITSVPYPARPPEWLMAQAMTGDELARRLLARNVSATEYHKTARVLRALFYSAPRVGADGAERTAPGTGNN